MLLESLRPREPPSVTVWSECGGVLSPPLNVGVVGALARSSSLPLSTEEADRVRRCLLMPSTAMEAGAGEVEFVAWLDLLTADALLPAAPVTRRLAAAGELSALELIPAAVGTSSLLLRVFPSKATPPSDPAEPTLDASSAANGRLLWLMLVLCLRNKPIAPPRGVVACELELSFCSSSAALELLVLTDRPLPFAGPAAREDIGMLRGVWAGVLPVDELPP